MIDIFGNSTALPVWGLMCMWERGSPLDTIYHCIKMIPAKHPNSQVGNPEELMLVGNQFYRQPVL